MHTPEDPNDRALAERVTAALAGAYEIEDEIGRGGMSVVYRARDVRLNRRVAVKVLPPQLAYDPAIRTRFRREAQTAAQLAHPNIVPIYDVGESEGIPYFVMALVDGGNLARLLAAEPKLPLEEARRLLCEIADALSYAHVRGVIHRDIKPDNILLHAETGRAVVTDFGIARAVEGGARLTVTGIAVGTPAYMSPEQAEGEREIDGRSDIYSLGVVGYQMLAGRIPFSGSSTMSLLLKHVTEKPRPIVELRPDTPRGLREAIDRALAKSRDERWPTADAFRESIMIGDAPQPAWRSERRDAVRYTSPIPESRRKEKDSSRSSSPRRGSAVARPDDAEREIAEPLPGQPIMVPPEFAHFTEQQRAENRLWHGRIDLLERVKTARGYLLLNLAMYAASIGGIAAAVETEVFPFAFAPLIPMWMTRKLVRRSRSLRASGLKLRRVYFSLRAKWAIPTPPPGIEKELGKRVSKKTLSGPHGAVLKRSARERDGILKLADALPQLDREMLPDLKPTADALFNRVVQLVESLTALEGSVDPREIADLDERLAMAGRDPETPENARRLELLRRHRESFDALIERRRTLEQQLENAEMALTALRLDLVKLRASGMEASLADVSNATQQARALSRDIGAVLEAANTSW